MQKKSKFLDIKLMIVTLSAAITMGLWNLLSTGLVQSTSTDQASKDPTPQPPSNTAQDLAPLPTLVNLMDYTTASLRQPVAASPSGQTSTLRSVVVPTQTIVQKHSPIVNQPAQVVITVNSGGGGNQGGGSSVSAPSAPVTTTKSSK